jgi:hypothetical protein
MSLHWSCCGTPMLDPAQESLESQDGAEVLLASCGHCGARWMSVVPQEGCPGYWEISCSSTASSRSGQR